MRHRIDPDTAAAMAKKALVLMAQKTIPFYWEKYLVWFGYLLGVNRDPETDIGRATDQGRLLSEKDVLDEILHTQHFTSDYRDKLKAFTAQLKNAGDRNEVHKIVADLMLDTVAVLQAGEQLKEHLAETTPKSGEPKPSLNEGRQKALADTVTSSKNRKAFDGQVETFLKVFREKGACFSVAMMDIDSFQQFNDRYGHPMGERVLKFLGALLADGMGEEDFMAPCGEGKFIILLAGASLEKAGLFVENVRKSLDGEQLIYAKTGQALGKITLSAGVSAVREGDTEETLVKRADDALYVAKQSGRNMVTSEVHLPGRDEEVKYRSRSHIHRHPSKPRGLPINP